MQLSDAPTFCPFDCPMFGTTCTPNNPFGPCMVSSEGSCAAYYRMFRNGSPSPTKR